MPSAGTRAPRRPPTQRRRERESALARDGGLHVQTGSKPIDQWNGKYFSQVLPFVIPRMVSGPDYDPLRRWRRRCDDAPHVSVQSFVAGFARRVEASCRVDWSALPMMRSVACKHRGTHHEHRCTLLRKARPHHAD